MWLGTCVDSVSGPDKWPFGSTKGRGLPFSLSALPIVPDDDVDIVEVTMTMTWTCLGVAICDQSLTNLQMFSKCTPYPIY